jgi:hypothetical protein
VVVDPDGDWKEPTQRETSVRADPLALAHGIAERLKAGAGAPPGALDGSVDRRRRAGSGEIEIES